MAGDGAGTGAGAKNKKFQLCNTAFIPVFVHISVLCFKDVVPVPTCLIMSMPANCLTTLQDTDQAPDPRKIVKVRILRSVSRIRHTGTNDELLLVLVNQLFRHCLNFEYRYGTGT